ncbi:hypothetical protein GGQ64_001186 [Rhizobium azooxidifex]|uniref:Uncharacterized protein n=1 Tax=Mycoplana azooxidifex TaxID=1636188 RepID=A0A7W6D500_9HYPH|nr:hypothetical protein [Mycoplana azooxidifex]MBB3975999.1 hypothetical protein [Mycoplana azooxidifex]
MLKLFLNPFTLVASLLPAPDDRDDAWIRDPLAHPDIEAMDERQRADLPFHSLPRAPDLSAPVACRT